MIAARRGRADAGVLHRLAQLVVLDELARRLHRAEQRSVAVAPRRLGFLALAVDLAHVHVLVLVQARQQLIGSLVILAAPLGLDPLVGGLAVDPAPAGYEQQPAFGLEDVCVLGPGRRARRRDGRLDPRVLEDRLGMEDREEAAHDHVVDALVVV
jgi:hypothetical protein